MEKICLIIMLGLIAACSTDKKSDNPYRESHIVDIIPHYRITPNSEPKLKRAIEDMSETELKNRYGELQNLSGGLTLVQEKEFKMIADRLDYLENTTKQDRTIYVKN